MVLSSVLTFASESRYSSSPTNFVDEQAERKNREISKAHTKPQSPRPDLLRQIIYGFMWNILCI